MNYVKEYSDKIKSKKIIAGQRVKKQYAKLVKEMNDSSLPFYFDEDAGNRPIEFIEKFCRQSEGNFGGKIELELFQKAWIQALFGFKWRDTGLRRFNESFFMVGRKNGKTTLLSALALYMMVADGEGAAEVYVVATKKDQAKKTFNSAAAMRFHSKAIASITKKRRTDMYMPSSLSTFEPLASDSDTLDGLNSHLIIIDELHNIKDRALYEVMKQSTGSRRQPMLIMITTAGTVRENIFDDMYDYSCKIVDGITTDDNYLPIIYELDGKEEWTDEKMWMKANPGLGTIKSLKYMRDMVKRAMDDRKMLKTVLTKDFNIRETNTESWLGFDDINTIDEQGHVCNEKFDIAMLKGYYAIGGADLSSTTDLTCATCMVVIGSKKYILQKYFMPNTVEQREKEDRVPYTLWRDSGLLTECQDVRVDYTEVTKWFVDLREKFGINTIWCGYDKWNAQYWTEEMIRNGFNMEMVIQGAITMSSPMKEIEADFKARNIIHNDNPILIWCLLNTVIRQDENQNIRPVKGKNVKQRIDGTVSLIDAYVIYIRHMADYHAYNGEG